MVNSVLRILGLILVIIGIAGVAFGVLILLSSGGSASGTLVDNLVSTLLLTPTWGGIICIILGTVSLKKGSQHSSIEEFQSPANEEKHIS